MGIGPVKADPIGNILNDRPVLSGFTRRLKNLVEKSLKTKRSKAYDRAAQLSKFRLASAGSPIRFGSDCSGMECLIEAFKRLGLRNRVIVEFCSDTDETCRLWLRHQALKPKKIYDDLKRRPLGEGCNMDIYAAGFPCQPWSSDGKGEGEADSHGRGDVFASILKHIAHARPKSFILENVKGLVSKTHKTAFDKMIANLKLDGAYTVGWRVYNTKDFGTPQNRPRVFIIGILTACEASKIFG